MLDFSNMKESDGAGKLPQGNHVMKLATVGKIKKNRGGNIGFCMWFEKEGFKPVMQYVQMTDNVYDKRRILNTLTAFNVTLEQREYKPKELYQLMKSKENKSCEVEVTLKDDDFVNDDGEKIEFKRREIATLKPLQQGPVEEIVGKDDELDELDLY